MDARDTASVVKTPLLKKTLFIILAALGLGIAFDYLFFGKVPGISFPIYIVLVLAALTGMARFFKTKIPKSAAALTGPLLFFSSMTFVWSGGFISFLNFAASIYLLGLMLYLVFEPKFTNYTTLDYLKPIFKLPIQLAVRCKETLLELSGVKQIVAKHKAMPQVIAGILIAIPVIALFIALFASADLVFRKYATDIFTLHLSGQFYGQTFIILMVALFFVGVFGFLMRVPDKTRLNASAKQGAVRPKGRGQIEVIILFSSLNVLFLCFIAVQLTYLFGGQHNITGQGFTYAQYARKGYFELIAVAAISFLLIFIADKVLLRPGEKHSTQFRFLAGALIAQVAIIMVSAFNRLSLYESAYGFTSLRLYSHICIMWLAAVFGILLYKIFVNQRESRFALLTFASVLVLLTFLNIVSVDKYVAHRNIARYYATGKLDTAYLGSLSNDSIPETAKLLNAPEAKVSQGVAALLYQRQQLLERNDKSWQSTNISRTRALNVLNAHTDYLKENQDKLVPSIMAQP